MEESPEPLARVAKYYDTRLAEHGATPRGVDWNGAESQVRRFDQLAKLMDGAGDFSVNDLGCGYGAFADYIANHFPSGRYTGYDISASMVESARARSQGAENRAFLVGSRPSQPADYGVASGIFNVRLSCDENQWRSIMEETMATLDRSSRLGFAFNCLTSYSDPEKMRDDLYYADPCAVFDYCKRRFSKNVALLHDYGLHEFTIHVRKSP